MKKITDYLKVIGKGVGKGSLVAGYGLLSILLYLWQFLLTASVGLSMIWWAITLFVNHSILFGLIVLIIGTPIAIGITTYFSIPLFFILVIAGIIWGVSHILGLGVSFYNAWAVVWFVVKVLVLGLLAFAITSGLFIAIREKKIVDFLKGYWFYILLFLFFLWFFFL